MHDGGLKRMLLGLAAALLLSVPAPAKTLGSNPKDGQVECPADLRSLATCYSGRDANGAWYLAAIPKVANGILVVHAHGGPRLGPPKADDPFEDLERFAAMVRSGYAWIGSTYRRGGYGVRMAAADVQNSRAVYWQRFGKPRRTILHGQSYGGNVAAKLAELAALDDDGNRLFDGVLLTNAVLWGGTKAYGFRADLRAVYQYYCRNHPGSDGPNYPVWQGLPPDSRMTRGELRARINDCTGVENAAAKRTSDQIRRLDAIVRVTGIAEDQLVRHMEWATFTFQDLVQLRLGGRNPFDNSKTMYRGSSDDAALNRDIQRFVADKQALTQLAYDSDLFGMIAVPTLALHWKDDPIVSAEADKDYESRIKVQGNADFFLRLVSGKGSHSRLPDADIIAALDALVTWIDSSEKPTGSAVRIACESLAARSRGNCTIQ